MRLRLASMLRLWQASVGFRVPHVAVAGFRAATVEGFRAAAATGFRAVAVTGFRAAATLQACVAEIPSAHDAASLQALA